MPSERKILVPKAISYNPRAKSNRVNYSGTRAFVPNGTMLPRGLKREEKSEFLKGLARGSSYYIKPLSERNKKIRRLLKKYGIFTEKVIEELKDGTALFEHEGLELGSPEGKALFAQRPDFFLKRIEGVVSKLLVLEVSHRHLHLGNFVITPEGKVVLLDLGRAVAANYGKMSNGRSKKQKQRIIHELNEFCDIFSRYYFMAVKNREPDNAEWAVIKKKVWEEIISRGVRFGNSVEREFKKNGVSILTG